jgi:hypothetical protein
MFVHRSTARARRSHSAHTIRQGLEALLANVTGRGLQTTESEAYSNGMRKVTYGDPDGNEVSARGSPM